mgnify:CR=1 FL=1
MEINIAPMILNGIFQGERITYFGCVRKANSITGNEKTMLTSRVLGPIPMSVLRLFLLDISHMFLSMPIFYHPRYSLAYIHLPRFSAPLSGGVDTDLHGLSAGSTTLEYALMGGRIYSDIGVGLLQRKDRFRSGI